MNSYIALKLKNNAIQVLIAILNKNTIIVIQPILYYISSETTKSENPSIK